MNRYPRCGYEQITPQLINQFTINLGKSLLKYLNNQSTQKQIAKADQPRADSKKIQDAILPQAKKLGFISEKKGLFTNHPTKGIRPDYFRKVGDSGILLEVERGKTTQNNMDLLDFWKCHICTEANYLFLIVPSRLQQNENKTPSNEFDKVSNRMLPFFKNGSYTNVLALFLYGYY